MTYIHCGMDGWCYCFNVIDVFTREWIAYIFDTAATAHTAVQSVLKAVSSVKDISHLRLRTDVSVHVVPNYIHLQVNFSQTIAQNMM